MGTLVLIQNWQKTSFTEKNKKNTIFEYFRKLGKNGRPWTENTFWNFQKGKR